MDRQGAPIHEHTPNYVRHERIDHVEIIITWVVSRREGVPKDGKGSETTPNLFEHHEKRVSGSQNNHLKGNPFVHVYHVTICIEHENNTSVDFQV